MVHLPQDITIYSAKADYSKTTEERTKFETGFKTNYVKRIIMPVMIHWENGQSFMTSTTSNHFVYEENINAAYVNFSTPLGKMEWPVRTQGWEY